MAPESTIKSGRFTDPDPVQCMHILENQSTNRMNERYRLIHFLSLNNCLRQQKHDHIIYHLICDVYCISNIVTYS